ncbi:hypothetical protein [uncultured Clostridium sp.]|jgi:hypothetical protein|uniref:hypothetical protein n=1 Tax=uncultured Clostridium sp. TaxID=59620 RepID=UPI00262B68FE|nr:hypothetical protein [uncultured Clostridium sp.]
MKARVKVFILQLLSYISLCGVYKYIILEDFEYNGFKYIKNDEKFLIGIIIILCILLIIMLVRDKFWFLVINIIVTMYLFGSVIYFQFSDGNIKVVLSQVILIITLIIFSNINIKNHLNKKNLENNISKKKILFIFSLGTMIVFIIFYGKYINLNNLFLIDVYETRLIFREVSISILDYIYAPLSRVILPILLIVYIRDKDKKKIYIITVCIIISYLFGANKSTLIGIFTIFLFYKGTYMKKCTNFLMAILLAGVLSLIGKILIGSSYIANAVLRRVLFLPTHLENIYYDFFENNYTYGMHTDLGTFFGEMKYNKDISRFIGEDIMGKADMNANVGVITEGFFSFGIFGVVIACIVVGMFFLYLNYMDVNPRYFGVAFTFIYYFNSSFLTTLLLTHGLLCLVFFIGIFLKNTNREEKT